MTSPTITGARRDLGSLLAHYREAAHHTQASLARKLGYSRSSVANAEVGQGAARNFWEMADEALNADGRLLSAFEQVEAMRGQSRIEPGLTALAGRDARATGAPGAAGLVLSSTLDTTLGERGGSRLTAVVDGDLRGEILDAYQRRAQRQQPPLSLTLVGGYAGSGKSEFARFLAAVTGWTILDKDTLTRALVEQLLISLGKDPNDRESGLYLDRVRSHEYRCLLDQGLENLDCGVSVILTAPFLREIKDASWLRRVENSCRAHRAALHVIWVRCDAESMHDYLSFRGASRDAWKLANWTDYLGGVDLDFKPDFPHYVVDNRLSAAVALTEQAADVARRIFNAL